MKLFYVSFVGLAAVASRSNLASGTAVDADQSKEAIGLATASNSADADLKSKNVSKIASQLDTLDSTSGWNPTVGDSWNYNLETPVKKKVDVDVFLIDMDDAEKTIRKLHKKGKHVVCYISIGTYEEWREDAGDFPDDILGTALADWEGEKWIDINSEVVKDIMIKRVQKAADMNCDGVEPDNMMVYTESNPGVSVSETEQIAYNVWFAATVQAHGMKVGLKNCVEIVPDLVQFFDFAVNEECNQYNECGVYKDTFLAEGKPVFNVEYVNNKDMCDYTNDMGMDTIIKNYNLKAHMCSCVDSARDYKCNKVMK